MVEVSIKKQPNANSRTLKPLDEMRPHTGVAKFKAGVFDMSKSMAGFRTTVFQKSIAGKRPRVGLQHPNLNRHEVSFENIG